MSALPAAFGLPENSKKGYFPHLFHTLQNQEYSCPLPDANFYAPNSMSIDERKDFFKWYEENKRDYVFNFNPLKTRQNLAEISRNELCHPLHNQKKKKIPVFFLLSITIVYNKLFKQITQNVVILQN